MIKIDVTDVLCILTKACQNKPPIYFLEEIYHYVSVYDNYIWVLFSDPAISRNLFKLLKFKNDKIHSLKL